MRRRAKTNEKGERLFSELVGFDSLFCGGGLGFLFAVTDAYTFDRLADINADSEGFVVVGPFFFDGVVGWGFSVGFLGEFLEVGLGVAPRAGIENVVNFGQNMLFYELFGFFVAFVEINGADDGLETVSEDDGVGAVGAVFFATREADEGCVAEFFAGGTDGLGADEGGAKGGHDTFGLVVVTKEEVGGNEFENGIAEKFETLVVGGGGFFMLIDVTAVGEGSNEQVDVIKFEAEFFFGESLIGGSVHVCLKFS